MLVAKEIGVAGKKVWETLLYTVDPGFGVRSVAVRDSHLAWHLCSVAQASNSPSCFLRICFHGWAPVLYSTGP